MKINLKIFVLSLTIAILMIVDTASAQRRGGGVGAMRGFRSNVSSFNPSRTRITSNFRRNASSVTANRLRGRGLNTSNAAGERRHVLYKKSNARTGQVYYGRASGTGNARSIVARRDQNHHMNKAGYSKAVLIRSSTNKAAIRGAEDKFISKNTQRGRSGNAIRGISPRNPNRAHYHRESRKLTNKLD